MSVSSFPIDPDWHSTLAAIAASEVDRLRARGSRIDREDAIDYCISEVWITVTKSSRPFTWGLVRIIARRRLVDHVRSSIARAAREEQHITHAPTTSNPWEEQDEAIALDQLVNRYVSHKSRTRRHVVEQQPQRQRSRERQRQIREGFTRYAQRILCRRFD